MSEASRRLVVLGATGTIGCHTLAVVDHLRDNGGPAFDVVGLAAGRQGEKLAEQAARRGTRSLALADEAAAGAARARLPGATVLHGPDAARRLVETSGATDVVAAMVGSAGLPAAIEAAERGVRLALANKETLVAAGELVTPIVAKSGGELVPVDSEHAAIFQCLAGQSRAVKRIVLTASGGPFRRSDPEAMARATVEDALKHPTWTMGQKITIDSATMMNKALEVIEAHWLFGLPPERIEVIVHPQSIAHSFVEFADHSILAQLGPPDMRTPIQYALTHPERADGGGEALDWRSLSRLDFEPPDPEKFPSLAMAREVIEAGGTSGAIFNAANEAAVEAFLARRIRFGDIFALIRSALDHVETRPAESLEAIWDADRRARSHVAERV